MSQTTKHPAIGYYTCLPIEDENSLLDIEIEESPLEAYDILVEVKACSVNPVDTKLRKRKAPENPNKAVILGFDAAGIVSKLGKNVVKFQKGDEVYYAGSLFRSGSNSKMQAIDSRLCALKPKTLSFAEAASLPLTMITAWEALFQKLEIQKTRNKQASLLIINGSGGAGSAGIQLAKKLSSLQVIATASRDASKAWCLSQGADIVIDHKKPLEKELQSHGIDCIDYIYCCYATDVYFEAMAKIIKPNGRICSIVDANNAIDINLLKSKSISFHWEFMGLAPTLSPEEIMQHGHILEKTAKLVEAGELQPTLTKKMSGIHAAHLKEAHSLIEKQKIIGKIVLEGWKNETLDGF